MNFVFERNHNKVLFTVAFRTDPRSLTLCFAFQLCFVSEQPTNYPSFSRTSISNPPLPLNQRPFLSPNQEETNELFDLCCFTWMARAPGAPCSHGFFQLFQKRHYWPVPSGGWGRVIPSVSTRGRISSLKKKERKGSKKKKGSKHKENLSCFAEISGEEGTAAKKLGW